MITKTNTVMTKNVFDKPEEQNDACIDSALARKGRTKSKMILLNASPRKNKNTALMQSIRENQWPKDLQAAYELGKRLLE